MRADELTVSAQDQPAMAWGSDAVAAMLAALELPYLALNPGATYRGLHDSIVNYLGNAKPVMLLCLHEEHAVAIAHGYAKVTERPIAVALHSNVGLMHATMALFNAWCDRVPVVVLGATGPLDAAERRPWIDWIHTAADQAALIRNYCKWDDQPGSPQAAVDSLMRADAYARAYPSAPTYVCLDAGIQEQALSVPVRLPDPARHGPGEPPPPAPQTLRRALDLLETAKRPLVLIGRVGRGQAAWDARVALVERLAACALTDLKVGAGFPSDHPCNPAAPGTFLSPAGRELLRAADVVLSLDAVDLGGTLRQAHGEDSVSTSVISCTMDEVLHNGWSKDHFAISPVDVSVPSHPDLLVAAMLEILGAGDAPERNNWPPTALPEPYPVHHDDGKISISDLADALRDALAGRPACLVRLPLGWQGSDLRLSHPLDYLGQDGGGGIGSGPGMAVGAALALQGSGRIPVAVIGDGDFLMGNTALWTAAHYELPILVIVANNRSFFNDEVHQERVALIRGRPVENRWVGMRISDPDPDLAGIARSLGLKGIGPVSDPSELRERLARAVDEVAGGAAVLVDVLVAAHGYPGSPGTERGAGS